MLIFLIYPSTCARIFEIFVCDTLDNGARYLIVDYSIHCDSPAHVWIQGYAWIMVFIYPFGMPLLYGYCMLRYRSVLLALQRNELSAAGRRQTARLEGEMRRSAQELGPALQSATLNVAEARAARLSYEMTTFAARDMHVVLHAGCVAWHTSETVPVPRGSLWLCKGSACDLVGEGDKVALHVTGSERPGAVATVFLTLRAAMPSDCEVDQPPPAQVLLAQWERAVRMEISATRSAVTEEAVAADAGQSAKDLAVAVGASGATALASGGAVCS